MNSDSPRDPTAVRKRLTTILERADCKHIRFHDLRHTFATASLEHGMDIKTLSTIIGQTIIHSMPSPQRLVLCRPDREHILERR